jgi:cation-transporting ATPase 13A1
MPMLKPGDASMASPFTAKASGVMPCTDIIKQGRCTLVTTVQVCGVHADARSSG